MNQFRSVLKRAMSALIYNSILKKMPSGRAKNSSDTDIAVVCLAALGDFIVFCSVARELKRQGKKLTLICREGTEIKEFAALTGYFDHVEALPHRFRDRPKNIRQLRQISASTVLVAPVQRHILSDIYAMAISADHRILPDTMLGCTLPRLKRKIDQKADILVPVTAVNEQERYEQYLQGAGLSNSPIMPFVFDWAKERIAPGKTCVAIFPGAGGGAAKQWPIQRFADVASSLVKEYNCKVLVCGTKSEAPLGEELCTLLHGRGTNLCGKTDLPQLIEVFRDVSVVLANDSGSAHIAIACGVPTVVICGCWEYGRFYPNPKLDIRHRVVILDHDRLKCVPCEKSRPDCTGGKGSAPCIANIDREDVLNSARTLYREWDIGCL